jgi:methylated-DNA-protein-cysteine methyltransferase-like protein
MIRRSKPLSNYEIIWNVVRQIPRGRVATYGEVAEQAGLPGQARLVGYALHHLPSDSSIPWHRVINARGAISFPPESPQYRRQIQRLRKDGIMVHRGKVDLSKFGWLKRTKRLRRSAG